MPEEIDRDDFESQLAGLAPRTAIDRDRLMYLAGRASVENDGLARSTRGLTRSVRSTTRSVRSTTRSVRSTTRSVRSATWALAAMTTAAGVLLAMVLHRPEPQVVERIVEKRVEVPAAVAVPEPAAPRVVERATPLPRSVPPAGYPRLLSALLEQGIEALPENVQTAQVPDDKPASYGRLREELLGPSMARDKAS